MATALGAAVLLLTGATYAVTSFLATAWERDPGLQRVLESGLATEFQMSKTIDGVTVTVHRAYADANRIAVGYAIDAPLSLGGQIGVGATRVELRDQTARQFAPAFGHGAAERDALSGAEVMIFDAGQLPGGVRSLDLELTIHEVRGLGGSVRGPWQFRFPLPVIPARSATASLVQAGLVTADVRLVTTPSETRVELQIADPTGRVWSPRGVRVEVGGRVYDPTWFRCDETLACSTHVFDTIPASDSVEWFVLVDALGLVGANGSETQTLSGPWRVRLVPR